MDTYDAILRHRAAVLEESRQCDMVLAALRAAAMRGVALDLNETAAESGLPLETVLRVAGCDVEVIHL